MPPLRMSPGTLLGGRYRLDDLLADHDGARFWRATDTVLARSVAVHAVASDDPRAARVLDAARRSAGLVEPHFLQVLDCDEADGVTWVINEWGDGVSLDIMLEQGPIPPVRAAWLTREVAEAVTAAHALDLAHGRLIPESVMVSQAGAVRIIGFQVNAALSRPRLLQPDEDELTADVLDLAGILYAALTGRWAGVSPSRVPSAPTTYARGPLRPRQVRAGVPRALDAICDRVLHRDPGGHLPPIRTALEISAALSDFVGDPAAAAPVDLPSMYDEPEPPAPVEDPPIEELMPGRAPGGTPDPDGAPPSDQPSLAAEGPSADPPPLETTMSAPIVFDDELDVPSPPTVDRSRKHALPTAWEPEPWTPESLTPFEQPTDRPLFAEHERRVPPGAPVVPIRPAPKTADSVTASATGPIVGTNAGQPGSPAYWLLEAAGEPSGDGSSRAGRSWLRLAGVVALVVAVLTAMVIAFTLGHRDDPAPPAGDRTPTTPAVTPSTTYPVVAATDFDPQGDPPSENPDQARLAIDGDPTTGWSTQTYRSAALGGLKEGVGLLLDLGTEQPVGSVEIKVAPESAPTQLELRATPPGVTTAPAGLDDTRRIDALATEAGAALFRLEPSVRTRYLLLWLTQLPGSGDDYRSTVLEVGVTS